MENPQRTPYNGFKGTPIAQVLGLVLGLCIPFVMMAAGLYRQICLFVFIGVLMFVIPKLFGVSSIKLLVLLGVVFLLLSTLVGAFVFTIPEIKDNGESNITGEFSDVTIIENDGKYDISVTYTGEAAGNMNLYYASVGTTTFRVILTMGKDPVAMTDAGAGVYTYTGLELDSVPYSMHFEKGEGDDAAKSDSFICTKNVSDSDITSLALKGNAYVAGMVTVMFLLIVFLTAWMRKNLEKTRARLEAEGRLYPQGYGRCKECGMLVLPGETVCRKCGAYIDIPDEIKEKMKHKVEYIECSECGAEVPADARRCPKCGANFDEETEEIHVQVSEEELRAEAESRAPAEEPAEGSEECFECSECGAMVPADAKKCPKCGAEFDEDE